MRATLIGIGLWLALCNAAQAVDAFPQNCKLTREASLPFYGDRGHMMIDVGVDDHPLHFVVDTGGFVSAISQDVARVMDLHLAHVGSAIEVKDAGGAEATHYAFIRHLTFSHLRTDNLTLLISELPEGEDGVLAPELLRNFDLEIDFATQTLNLFRPPPCAEHVVYWTDDFAKVPLTVTLQGHIKIPVIVNGHSVTAMIDTGSPKSLLTSKFARAIFGEGALSGEQQTLTGGQGGKLSGVSVALDSLIIGKFKWNSPALIATADTPGKRWDGSEVLLGLDVLHDLHLFIDYKGSQLYVSKR